MESKLLAAMLAGSGIGFALTEVMQDAPDLRWVAAGMATTVLGVALLLWLDWRATHAIRKPRMKPGLVLRSAVYDEELGPLISFYCPPDRMCVLEDFDDFGYVAMAAKRDEYLLKVDKRFDFEEVVAYIKSREG